MRLSIYGRFAFVFIHLISNIWHKDISVRILRFGLNARKKKKMSNDIDSLLYLKY